MSVVHVSPADSSTVAAAVSSPVTATETLPHTWRLSGIDFEDGVTTRCFECVACGAVRYS